MLRTLMAADDEPAPYSPQLTRSVAAWRSASEGKECRSVCGLTTFSPARSANAVTRNTIPRALRAPPLCERDSASQSLAGRTASHAASARVFMNALADSAYLNLMPVIENSS